MYNDGSSTRKKNPERNFFEWGWPREQVSEGDFSIATKLIAPLDYSKASKHHDIEILGTHGPLRLITPLICIYRYN